MEIETNSNHTNQSLNGFKMIKSRKKKKKVALVGTVISTHKDDVIITDLPTHNESPKCIEIHNSKDQNYFKSNDNDMITSINKPEKEYSSTLDNIEYLEKITNSFNSFNIDDKNSNQKCDNFEKKPFLSKALQNCQSSSIRKIYVPQHRLTPLRNNWIQLIEPLVKHMKMQVRMNTKTRCVELRIPFQLLVNYYSNSLAYETTNKVDFEDDQYNQLFNKFKVSQEYLNLEKCADYIKAFILGFELKDAVALLRLDDLFIETFEIKDVKRLNHNHLSRCIGRIAGKNGKTKFFIENMTRTRIVIANDKINLLGNYQSIRFAREAVCNLILGSPPSKIFSKLKNVASKYQNMP